MNAYMTCPKCHQAMQSFTRSGLTVEQCSGCRGVFLDYGELERLVQMEGQYHQQMAPQQHMPPPAAPMHGAPVLSHGHGHGHVQYHGHAFGHRPHSKHYRKSLLGELFLD